MRQSVRVVGLLLTLLLCAITLASAQTGELTIAVATDPLTLDPRGASNVISWSLAYHIADPLVGKDKDLKIVPLLAESWDRPDPVTWRFKLRRGVKFQNGEDVTAAAVKATLDVMIDPELAKTKKIQVSAFIRGNFRTVERVEAPDPYTVIIKTKAPYRPMLLGLSQLGIAPASALDGGEAYVAHPVGAGPYKFVEYVPGSRLVLEANSTYWGAKPAFKRVTVRIIPENATRVAALQTGEVLAIYNVPPDTIDRLKGNKDLVVQDTLTTRYNYLYLQNDRPPFNDKRVRLAINYALDKDQITRVIFKGLAKPASAPMGPATAFFDKALRPYPFDVAKAKALLAEAGYPNGLKFVMGTPFGRFINDRQVAEAVVGQLAKAGFTVDLRVEEWGTSLANLMARKYDAMFGAYGGSPDPDYMLSWLFTAKSSVVGFSKPEVETLLLEGLQAPDDAAARKIYERIQKIVWEDVPLGFLYFQPDIVAFSKRLKGFGPRVDEYVDVRDARLE
jgi:peptide/nickel transport system substrate-binding protein